VTLRKSNLNPQLLPHSEIRACHVTANLCVVLVITNLQLRPTLAYVKTPHPSVHPTKVFDFTMIVKFSTSIVCFYLVIGSTRGVSVFLLQWRNLFWFMQDDEFASTPRPRPLPGICIVRLPHHCRAAGTSPPKQQPYGTTGIPCRHDLMSSSSQGSILQFSLQPRTFFWPQIRQNHMFLATRLCVGDQVGHCIEPQDSTKVLIAHVRETLFAHLRKFDKVYCVSTKVELN